MIVTDKKELRRKFIGDIPAEDMELIEKACELERRSRISVIRKGAVDYAKKIIEREEVSA